MWINNRIAKPLKEGKYKTLVDWDGFGNLQEIQEEYFNGEAWDLYESSSNIICFWWAEKEDYETIVDYLEDEQQKYATEMEEHSKNFGGL